MGESINSYIGLGHTRWATHGGKTDNNAHPHMSNNGNIILVHNGIINNFNELKSKLKDEGYIFSSETDTEVIANLIEYYLEDNNIEDAINKTISDLEGTWALVIIYTKEIAKFYVTRQGSPLLLGEDEKYIICTSEINGFAGLLYDYIVLDNHHIIKIYDNKYESISKNSYTLKKITNNEIVSKPNEYKHWMIKEIMEQPETIQKAYNNGGRIIDNNIKLGGLEHLKNNLSIEHVIILEKINMKKK